REAVVDEGERGGNEEECQEKRRGAHVLARWPNLNVAFSLAAEVRSHGRGGCGGDDTSGTGSEQPSSSLSWSAGGAIRSDGMAKRPVLPAWFPLVMLGTLSANMLAGWT